MKYSIFNYIKIILLSGAVMLLLIMACKKNDLTQSELYVYVPSGDIAANINSGNYNLLRSTLLPAGSEGFPAVITRPYNKDILVTAKIDTSLIKQFDSIHGTESPRIPEGTFILKNSTVTIKAGQTASADSFHLDVADASKLLHGAQNAYIVPLVLSENSSLPVSPFRQVMYVKVTLIPVLSSIISSFSQNTIAVPVTYTPISISGTDKVSFAGLLNKAVPKDVEITIGIAENAEVDAYNKKNNTSYKYFPAGTYNLLKNTVTVTAGSTGSLDSFSVGFTDYSSFLKDSSYMLALTIKDEGLVEADTNYNKLYITVSPSFSNIDFSNTASPANLLSRSGWTVAAKGGETYGAATNVLDNNYNTSWLTPVSTAWVTIDMGAVNKLSGIQLSPNYTYDVYYNISVFDIATSNDNVAWQQQGRYMGSVFRGTPDDPDMRNVHFYTPVQARYFRITYANIGGSFAGASEIKGF